MGGPPFLTRGAALAHSPPGALKLPLGLLGRGRPNSPRLSPQWSFAVATITEIPPVIFLPNFLVQRKVLRPLRTQTGGTIMVGGAWGAVAGRELPALAPSLPGPLPTWGFPFRMPHPAE